MYEAHFGLRVRPFVESVCPSGYVELPSRETILRRVRYALEQSRGAALIFGPPGSGKTLLARTLADSLGGPSAHLTFPVWPLTELLPFLADEIDPGSARGDGSLGGSMRRLRRSLAASVERGDRPLLIVDEAHLIDDPATFEGFRMLLNFASAGPPDLSLVLVGGPEVLLRLPAGLGDRLAARCLIGPLTEEETATYVLGRLAAAGAGVPLFNPESLALLHRAAEGLPRRLNRLADLALLIAYAENRPEPDAQTVRIAARELDPDALAA